MSHINYLLKNPINKVEELKEVAFVKNVAHEVTKFSFVFIYNHYKPLMSIRTENHMKDFY